MFETEITLNRFLLEYFDKIVADIPQDRLAERPAGNGHPPVWLLGHLALCAEFGLKIFGTPIEHPQWMEIFGPGSSDDVPNAEQYHKEDFVAIIRQGYPRLNEAAKHAHPEAMNQPHGFGLLENTPIETIGEMVAHLMTTHFAIHLAQLSGWRRASGKSALF